MSTKRSIINNRLAIIEAKIIELRTKAELGSIKAKEIIWTLAELEQHVRNTHADFVALENEE